jgi:NTP pyrophosphatase (non-canonical NTP hydrolase)
MSTPKKYRVNHGNYKVASIDDYHEDFAAIWTRDTNERSVFDLWMHVVDHASRVARAIRRQWPAAVLDDIADTTVWLLSLIAQCNNSPVELDIPFRFVEKPSDIIWMKYPAMCPACFDYWFVGLASENPSLTPTKGLLPSSNIVTEALIRKADAYKGVEVCTCLAKATNFVQEKDLIGRNRSLLDAIRCSYAQILVSKGQKITKINDVQNMFREIYSNVQGVIDIESVAFHLLEEIGEMSQALKDLYTYNNVDEPFTPRLHEIRRRRLFDELADVFSWLFTLPLKIESSLMRPAREYRQLLQKDSRDSQSVTLNIAEIIWAKYGRTESGANWEHLKCPACIDEPCSCGRDLKLKWRPGVEGEVLAASSIAMEKQSPKRDLVFISYSHKDAEWLQKLNLMLNPLVGSGSVSVWSDKKIAAGQQWRSEIESALARTRIGVLLVSDNFLASNFITKNELPPLLQAAVKENVSILWIPISHCLWKKTPIATYHPASDPESPLDTLSEAQAKQALMKIGEKIDDLISK